MAEITGTFAATGQSAELASPSGVTIQMDFAGTASVNVESKLPTGTWIVLEAVTADYHKVYDSLAPVRLNCTARTNNVVYALTSR